MAQLDVYRRPDGYLLDCQTDILSHLSTRFVVPLLPIDDAPRRHPQLTPVFEVDDRQLVMSTQFALTVTRAELGTRIESLAEHRYVILAALDMLITGI